MEEGREPKIGFGEAVLIATPLFTLELVSAIFVVVGPWILNVIVAPPLAFYLKRKGVPMLRPILAWIAEWIPILNELPLHTLGFLWAVAAERSEALGKITQEVARAAATAKKAGTKKGGPTAAESERAKGDGAARTPASAEPGEGAARPEGAGSSREETGAGGKPAERSPGASIPSPEGEEIPGAPPPGKGGAAQDLEKSEVETFGAKPEPLSKYETEEIVNPRELKDVEPPRRNEGKR